MCITPKYPFHRDHPLDKIQLQDLVPTVSTDETRGEADDDGKIGIWYVPLQSLQRQDNHTTLVPRGLSI
jgi:hypothetical protein